MENGIKDFCAMVSYTGDVTNYRNTFLATWQHMNWRTFIEWLTWSCKFRRFEKFNIFCISANSSFCVKKTTFKDLIKNINWDMSMRKSFFWHGRTGSMSLTCVAISASPTTRICSQKDLNNFLLAEQNFYRLKYTHIRFRCLENSKNHH